MAEQYNTVTVPGIGDIDFPSGMSPDDMHAAISKSFPQLGQLNQTAAGHAIDAAMRSTAEPYADQKSWGVKPMALPNLFPSAPDASVATPEGKARRAAINTWKNKQGAGQRAFEQNVNDAANKTVAPVSQGDGVRAAAGFSFPTVGVPSAPSVINQNTYLPETFKLSNGKEIPLKQVDSLIMGNKLSRADIDRYHEMLDNQQEASGRITPTNFEQITHLNDPLAVPRLLDMAINPYVPTAKGHEQILGPDFHYFEKDVPEFYAPDHGTPGTLEHGDTKTQAFFRGLGRGGVNAVYGAATPENAALLAATGGEGLLGKVAGAAFTVQAGQQAGESSIRAIRAAAKGNFAEAGEEGFNAGMNALFAGLGGLHTAAGLKAEATATATRRAAEDTVAQHEAQQAPTPTPQVAESGVSTVPAKEVTPQATNPSSAIEPARAPVDPYAEPNYPYNPELTDPAMGTEARRAKAQVPPPTEFSQAAYDKAQAAIDTREDELEKQGINLTRLYRTDEAGNKILQGVDDWKPMPPDLEALYHARDQIGAGMLQGSIGEISQRMIRAGVPHGDVKGVLDYYAMSPDRTDAVGQYMASEHSQGMVNEVPLKRQFEALYIKLATKRGIDISTSDLEQGVYRDAKTVADVKAALKAVHGYFKGIPEEGQAALPAPAAPVEAELKPEVAAQQEAQPQATNPSSPDKSSALEKPLRKLVGAIMGIQRLSESATRRLNVEIALRKVAGGTGKISASEEATKGLLSADELAQAKKIQGKANNQNPLASPNKNLGELTKPEQQMIKSVAEALEIPVSALRSEGWRLSDQQVATLESMRSAGLKPFSLHALDPEHPIGKFLDNVHHPLADINTENARAAGVPDPKNLWKQISPAFAKLRAERGATRAKNREIVRDENGKPVKQAPATAPTKAVDRTPEEQAIYDQTLQKIADAAGTTVKALQESNFALTGVQRAGVLDLVKREPSVADALRDLANRAAEKPNRAVSDAGLVEGDRHALEDTGTVSKQGKTIDDLQFEHDAMQDVLRRRLKQAQSTLNEKMKPWRDARKTAQNPSQLALDLTNLTPKDVKGIPEELYAEEHTTPKATETNEASSKQESVQGTEKAGTSTTSEASKAELDKPKGEGVTLHANPIIPALKALFGFKKPTGVAQFTAGVTLRDNPIEQLTASMDVSGTTPRDEINAYIANENRKVAEIVRNTPRITKNFVDTLQTGLKAAWDAYAKRPGMDALQWAFGRRRLQLSQNALVMRAFAERVKKAHPDAARREAMVNYLQAMGGRMSDTLVNGMLQQKANSFANRADNMHLKQGYIDAQNLTAAEKATVEEYRQYDKMLNDQERAEGMDIQAHENYVRQMWSHDSLAQHAIDAVASASPFATAGSFTKMRHFEDYFEGEMSGFIPKNKDLGYLIATRARASAEVLANRTFVKELYREKMPDGSQMAMVQGTGYSSEIDPNDPNKAGAVFIKGTRPQDAVTADGRAYVVMDHPAFQDWKWVGSAEDGTQIMYKGNMLVHPDIAKQLRNVLGKSSVRDFAVGRLALKASSLGKQTLLIGLFHPVQLGIHFLEHAAEGGTSARAMNALNPFSKSVIDLNEKVQQMLVVHGLKIADFDAESMWDEGVMSRGLASGSPYIGGFWRNLHDAMFTKYIPNIKMAMAMDALDRNMSRYHDAYTAEEIKNAGGKVTPQEKLIASQQAQSRIYRMTSEQMNSAFGGINWDALPVNKTFQDFARLTVLAPDFLLARMQFVGDSFRPGGWESRRALLTGAFLQYAAARAFNSAMNDGDPKWDIHDWNKFIVGKNEYSLRTVQGDLTDSILDTRRFIEHRLNPITMRPLIEAGMYPGSGGPRDIYGHPLRGMDGAGQQLLDFAKNIVPMPAQGLVDALAGKETRLRGPQDDDRIADTFIASMTGIRRSKYRTPAERIIFSHFDNLNPPTAPDDPLSLEQKNTFNRLRNAYQAGKLSDDDLDKAIDSGKLKQSEYRYLFRTATETNLKTRARHLPVMDLLDAWPAAKPAEKFQLAPLIQQKLKNLPREEQDKYQDMLDKFRDTLSPEDDEKIGNEIQKDIDFEHPPMEEDNQ